VLHKLAIVLAETLFLDATHLNESHYEIMALTSEDGGNYEEKKKVIKL